MTLRQAQGKAARDHKRIRGSRKPPLHLIPDSAAIQEAMALRSGGVKHGFWNWRENPIEAGEHIAAVRRHIALGMDGEENAIDTGISHLAHARATLGILLDAQACGTLIDDRPPNGAAGPMMARHTRPVKKTKRRTRHLQHRRGR